MKFEQMMGCTTKEFFEIHWEKNLLLAKFSCDLEVASNLNEWSEELLSEVAGQGDVIMVKDSQYVKQSFLIDEGLVNLKKIKFLWGEGFTFYARNISKFFPRVAELTTALEEELYPLKIEANVFLTPSGQTGFNPHFDCHDVIAIQLGGSKRWKFWPAIKQDMDYERPTEKDQEMVDQAIFGVDPALEKVMYPGDGFYMPRGVIHGPQSLASSCHLTLWLKSPLVKKVNVNRQSQFQKCDYETHYF
ncbi:MAG: hypothetical protein H6626_10750 [Pseudobdellovibrionaceae bacterium]|nr:hypothetical protein [Bdellovibrionales bacterium]USN46683.1 MAG: hypothetical protein H6626_10750 [Pseudobdellovibrionaceae bacterium]